jgi:hypothetical protein
MSTSYTLTQRSHFVDQKYAVRFDSTFLHLCFAPNFATKLISTEKSGKNSGKAGNLGRTTALYQKRREVIC